MFSLPNITAQGVKSNINSLDDLKVDFSNSKHFLKICHVNVENLQVHRDTFLNSFSNAMFDVITVSETFLKPIIPSTPYLIKDYDLLRHDRESKEGGGLAVYIKKGLIYKLVATSEARYCRKPEFIIIELSLPLSWKLLLCVVYRPPKLGHILEVFDIVQNLLPVYDNVVLMGDFNINLSTDRTFSDKTQLLNLTNRLNLNVLPLEATYHRPNSESLLDLIIVNDLTRVKNFGQISVSGLSYHDLIFLELNLKHKLFISKGGIKVRDFKNVNVDELKAECSSLNWGNVYLCNGLEDKVKILEDNILALYDKYVPVKFISKKRNPCPWLNNEIKGLMKQRDILYRRYIRTKDLLVWEEYRTIRNRVKRIVRDARNKYLTEALSIEKSSKEMWNILRNNGSGRESKHLTDPTVDLNTLNSFFCGVNNDINPNLIDYYKSKRDDTKVNFKFSLVDSDMVYKCISEISSNAIGNDNIPIRFIKIIFEEIKLILCHIFNYSLVNAEYPSQWKKALILPLPKTKNPSESKHYRSINILCVLGKILDKLVYKQVKRFLDENSILFKYQSGYRSCYSTETALVKITDDIRSGIDKKQLTVLTLLDFTRAFDSVNHELLLSILVSYNFSSESVIWFKSFLKNRCQRVRTSNGDFSDWMMNPIGVPQGSTLSAMLFSIYINRINECLMFCKAMLYADDMQLYIQVYLKDINNAIGLINADLQMVYSWCIDHGLSLNIPKCKPIIIGSSRYINGLNYDDISPVVINQVELPYESQVVNLGLRFNNTLSWSEQVSYICKKVYQSVYQFKRLCFNPSLEVRKLLVVTMIFPFFDYVNTAYCDLNVSLINDLQKAQNACIRYIYNLNYYEHVTPYYKQLGWLKIKERLDFKVVLLTYKLFKHRKPDYLFEKYVTLHNVHLRETRFGNNILQFPIHRTVTYTNSFHVKSIRLINNLDNDIKQCTSEELFIHKVKNKLLDRYQ